MLRALVRMIFSSRLPSASSLFGYSSTNTREKPHDHSRREPEFLQDFEMLSILSESDEHGIGNIGVDFCLAGSHHVRDAVRRRGLRRKPFLEFARPFGPLRIAMHQCYTVKT